ncbi:MAG: hypothetical protein NMNS01_24500 [Nitrosomonas sp.]|nr:MAG: hypothetical protein NMNS01_24500 [Nitrosomonas sp.]
MRRTENFPKKMTLFDENDDCYLKIGIHIPSKLNKNSFMIFKGPLNASLSALILSAIAGHSHLGMAKDEAMICAATKAIACHKEDDCIYGTAASINLPLLIKINPEQNEIVCVRDTGERDAY